MYKRQIHEELLKSAELTGLWEKKLRQIERGTYEARTFLDELKQMVNEVVINVLSDQTRRTITIEDTSKAAKETPKDEPKEKKEKKPRKPRAKKEKEKAEATPELELPSTDKPCLLYTSWSSEALEQVRVSTQDLRSAEGNIIPKDRITFELVRYVLSNYPYAEKKAIDVYKRQAYICQRPSPNGNKRQSWRT